jgi:hypothetical protein
VTDRVTAFLPCPACGRDCTWNGVYAERGGTDWLILCERCDWTWVEQATRARERTA